MKNSFKLRSLSIAALIGLASMGMAQGATLDEVDLSQQPLDTPTLDYLGQNGVIYQKDTDADGVLDTPIDVDGDGVANDPLKSAYTLTETTDTTLDNVITKYVYDETNATLTEKHYQVSLKQTVYGEIEKTPTEVKYFNWATDANDSKTLVSGTSVTGVNGITYNVYTDPSILNATERINSNQSGADLNMNFKNLSVSTDGAAIYNKGTIGNISGDFIGNYAKKDYSVTGGVIYNPNGTIGNITGDFIGNYAISNNSDISGGIIYNYKNSVLKHEVG